MGTYSDRGTLLFLGLMVMIASLVMFIKTWRFVKSANSTTGQVIDYGVAAGSTAGSKSTTAVVRFTVANKEYKTHGIILSKKNYFIGKKVKVLYDPANPTRSYINSIFHLYFFEMIFAVFGIFLLLVFGAGK